MRKKFTLLSVCALSVALIFMIGVAINAQWLNHLDDFFMENRLVNISFLTVFTGAMAKVATIGPMLIIFSFLAFFLWRKQQRALAIWCLGNLIFVSGVGYLLKQVF
ncbi:MAG: phosphatase PAP2/LCP family protein, partial [Enterococcus sp.]